MKKSQRKPVWYGKFHGCGHCGRMATWHYSPCGEREEKKRYLCEECISRGCSCQIDEETGKPLLDKKGRELPCVEYFSYPNGYPFVWPKRSHLRKRPAGSLRKWYEYTERFDHRRWRGQLRHWLKHQPTDWFPPARTRWRNDLNATRLLKQIYPILMAMKAQESSEELSDRDD